VNLGGRRCLDVQNTLDLWNTNPMRQRYCKANLGPLVSLLGSVSHHGPNRSRGIVGYFRRCHLLDSGESLGALWIGRYPDSGKGRKRLVGVPKGALQASRRRADPAEAMCPT
jgi:hypothetical protein